MSTTIPLSRSCRAKSRHVGPRVPRLRSTRTDVGGMKNPMTEVAQHPSVPPGNPEIADAAPPPAPTTVRRQDYRPPNWLVPEIALDFALGLETTRVRSTLSVEKNPAGDGSATIRLNGDGINVTSLALDGQHFNSWAMDGDDLLIDLPGDRHTIEIETRIHPAANSQLSGLYASNGMLCTQCEAEGFRRITFFPDRPDVLSRYRVRMAADKERFPVLLANGNEVATGEDFARDGDGTHWAEWRDPWPKPSYLFALVAGELVANRDGFLTRSGRKVDLAIYVRPGDETRTDHAMASLKAAM